MKELNNSVKDFIEALTNVPATQLKHIESTLRQLRADLTNSNLPVLAELDDLIVDAAIAKAEENAMLKGCIGPEEYQDDDEYYYAMEYYERYGCYPGESI